LSAGLLEKSKTHPIETRKTLPKNETGLSIPKRLQSAGENKVRRRNNFRSFSKQPSEELL